MLQIQKVWNRDFTPVNLLFWLIEPTNLFWAPPFICKFKSLNISFLICTLCRDLHLESCILCISPENLVIASLCSRELLWIGFGTGALLYTIFNPVTQTPSLRCCQTFHPLCWLEHFYCIGQDSVERKRKSNLCQSYGDFERCPHYDEVRVKFMGDSHKSGCCFWCSVSIIAMCHGRQCGKHQPLIWVPCAKADSTSYAWLYCAFL